MRRKLLVSTATAAILSGFMIAAAQEMPRGSKQDTPMQNQQSPASRSESPAAREATPQRQQEIQGSQGQRSEQDKAKQAQPKPDRNRNQQTTGQGQRGEEGKAKQAQPKPDRNRNQQTTGQGQRGEEGKAKQAQPKPDRNRNQQTTGQGQRDEIKSKQAQPKPSGSDQTAGQGAQQNNRQDDSRASAQGRIDLSVEQRTRIRQTIFSRSDVPRVTTVNFSISVGTVVPTRVRVVAVPAAIVEIRPEFRNHLYFVVRDEIVIVDNRRRIVAVMPVDTARGDGGPSVARGGDADVLVDLSPDEIRKVQLVLIEQGFSIEADGRLGPATRRALITFQQRNGLQASGRIDSRTVAKLGVSIRSNEGGSGQQPATTGQGGSGQQPPAARGSGQPQSGAAQQGTDRQGERPAAGQSGSKSNGIRSGAGTTGQGGQGSAQNPDAQGSPSGEATRPSNAGQGNAGSPAAKPAPQGGAGGGGGSR
jgi:hypothetical protein